MISRKILVGIAAAVVFVIGAAYIVYAGRPVMKNTYPSSTTTEQAPSGQMGLYTMADVQSHNTRESCWAAINGNVYDLTTWISRHPGGETPIVGLCGTDGTAAFTNQHGGQSRPASMLALLKIGTIK